MTNRVRPFSNGLLTACSLLALLFWATPASAQWDDRSDELPGITSGRTLVIVAAVAAAAAIVIWQVTKDDDDENADPQGTGDASGIQLRPACTAACSQLGAVPDEPPPLTARTSFILGLGSDTRPDGRPVIQLGLLLRAF
jgi:hypothetical protein